MINHIIFTLVVLCALAVDSMSPLHACGCSASNDIKGIQDIDNSTGTNNDSSRQVEPHPVNPSV